MSQTERIRRVLTEAWEHLAPLETPDDEMSEKIAKAFSLPLEYVKGIGIFREWEQVMNYYPDVVATFRRMMFAELPQYSRWGNTLYQWLGWTSRDFLWQVEFRRARFFAFAVEEIHVQPGYDPDFGDDVVNVEMTFTPEFEAMIENARERESSSARGAIRVYSGEQLLSELVRDAHEAAGESFDEAAFLAGFDSDTQ